MTPLRTWIVSVFVTTLVSDQCLQKCDARSRFRRQDTDSTSNVSYWPDGIIPYHLPTSYSEDERNQILVGMRRWEQSTCLKFVPWSSDVRQQLGDVRYLDFINVNTCFSRYGMHFIQPQPIAIGPGCMGLDSIIHELGHAIGMRHTMERNDRDTYIRVHYENINPDSRGNYDTAAMKGETYPYYDTPYDYKSIMHYGPNYWSNNDKPTMVAEDPAYQSVIGTAKSVSFYDAVYVNRAYQCADRCTTSRMWCHNGGVVGSTWDGECFCLCPDGFMGQHCESPLPGYQHIVQWNCGNHWEFANGNCYRFFPSSTLNYTKATDLCAKHGGTLVSIQNNEEVEWLRKRMDDYFLTQSLSSFWLGIKRRAHETSYLQSDGSSFDPGLLPLHEMGTSDADGCATTDGQSIVIDSCDSKPDNGIVCLKAFDTDCGGRYRLTSTPVTIQSPGFSSGYPASMTCQYVLQSNYRMKVEISMESFDILESANCQKDFIDVKLTNDVSHRGNKYCGSSLLNQTLVSEGNLAILTFKSNARNSGPGFKARVKAVPNGDMNSNFETNTGLSVLGGFIRSNSNNYGSSTAPPDTQTHDSFLESLRNLLIHMTVSYIL